MAKLAHIEIIINDDGTMQVECRGDYSNEPGPPPHRSYSAKDWAEVGQKVEDAKKELAAIKSGKKQEKGNKSVSAFMEAPSDD